MSCRRASGRRAGQSPGPHRRPDRQGVRGPGAAPARVVPLRRAVLDAGDDGHGPQSRPERRGSSSVSPPLSGDPHFAQDSYRRLVQMFGSVVLGHRDEPVRADPRRRPPRRRGDQRHRARRRASWRRIAQKFREPIATGSFPDDPHGATPSRRRGGLPVVEREAGHRLPQRHRHRPRPGHRGQHPGDGVRQHGDGLRHRGGDVAERRHRRAEDRRATTCSTPRGRTWSPGRGRPRTSTDLAQGDARRLRTSSARISTALERHYRDMQDMEFTVERGQAVAPPDP